MKLLVPSFAVLLIAGPPLAVPDDLENAFEKLKEAESRKDAAQVKKLAVETCELARRVKAAPAPDNEGEKEAWASRVAHAHAIELHTEYALYATAVQAAAPTTVDLLSTLEQQNPKSKYLDEAYGRYLQALSQIGAESKIQNVAEKALVHLPDNEDLLLALAEIELNHKHSDRAHGHAERVVAVLNKHPKPEGLSAAAWERKKTAALGRGYWIAGLVHSEKNQFYEADKDLRAALPLIGGNDAMLAAALFYLGVANYQIGRTMLNKAQVLEAAKFSDEAAAIKGPYAQQAWRNAHIMRTEALKMR